MNWSAKSFSPIVSLICLSLLITSCKKEGDFNLGAVPGSTVGTNFTDTLTLKSETFLLNDSLISAKPAFMSFGGYNDPLSTGVTFAEAYTSLTVYQPNKDYSGAIIDSANLYLYYSYAYGDTLMSQDFSVHQINTQLDASVPYQTTSNFVMYDPTIAGSLNNYKATPGKRISMSIPLTNAFATTLLNAADDRNNTDFNSNFYGIAIKSNNNTTGSVIRSNYTFVDVNKNTIPTRLTVYFKKGGKSDSTLFLLTQYTPSYNKIITDRTGSPISSLVSNLDNIPESILTNKCYVQAGTGVVTKVTIPNLSSLTNINGASVVINKAVLIMPLDETSEINKFFGVNEIGLLEVNPDNSPKYRNGQLSYVQSNTVNNAGKYYNQTASVNTSAVGSDYRLDITRYIQLLVNGKYSNDGFIINPYQNSFYVNRSVLNSFNAPKDNMRIELYYTKIK